MVTKFPTFVFCGRDAKKRELIEVLDPDEKYKVKSLLPFLGKRVIDWQIEELRKSPFVDEIYLLGLTEEMAKFDFPVHYVPVPTISTYGEKLLAGLKYLRDLGKDDKMIVVSSSDTPGITVEPINEFFKQVEENLDYDYLQSVVPDKIASKEFPDHKRITGRFSDIYVFPGELFAMSAKAIEANHHLIDELGGRRRIIKDHKRTKKYSTLIPLLKMILRTPSSWFLIFKYIIGRLPLAGAEKIVERISKMKAKPIIISDAGFGMDMDLSEDYEKLRNFVSKTKNVKLINNEL